MKRTISLVCALLCVGCLAVLAQPFNVKKASKAVFTLKTFGADGTLIGSANGFFVGDDGVAVSSFAPFRGASRAVVIDAQGKEWPVQEILGANQSYDVIKFSVGVKKSQGLSVASQPLFTGSEAWVLSVGSRRSVEARRAQVRRVEQFAGDYAYYTLAVDGNLSDGQSDNYAVLTADGMVAGITQAAASATDSLAYAVDMRLADSLRITGLSINDAALRLTHIKKALPAQLQQALLTLYVAPASLDSASYAQLVDDFIVRFPQAPEGYEYRAQLKLDANDFEGARKDMEQALAVAEKKDEAHFSYSKLIFQKELYKSQFPFEPWSLDKALDEARQAYDVTPQPIYLRQQANILFAQKKFAEASDIYGQLTTSQLRSSELFYEASRCREQLGDTLGQLALLDSAVCLFSRPLLQEAAPYLLARAQVRLDVGMFRDAVNDLNDYESLMRSHLTSRFYYLRYQAEVGGRLFQQALNDIDRAITMEPDYDLFYAEKASLQVRVGLYDDAEVTARQCIDKAPDHSDGYLFLGLAQCLKGNKAEGVKNLTKARELGDQQADDLIAKYAQ